MTAETAARILELRAQGRRTVEVSSELKLPLPTVETWVGKKWATGNLALRLSKMPDYEQFKDRIQAAVHALGLHSGELPPPSNGARRPVTAGQLAIALEIAAEPDKHRPEQGSFNEYMAQKAGVTPGALRGWIRESGALVRGADSVRNMPGFAQNAERLLNALAKHGQHDAVKALATAEYEHHRHMSTELLANVLTDAARDPNKSLRDLGLKWNIHDRVLSQFIGAGGVLRATPEKLAELPDYADHAANLGAVLAALGKGEQARGLIPPQIPTTEFLNLSRQHFGALMAVVDRMAARPATDLNSQAQQSGLPPRMLAVLFDATGALRPAADIHQRLAGMEPYLQAGVSDMLGRIADRHAGVDAAAPDALMKRIDLTHKGTAPDKTLILRFESADPGPNVRNRLEAIYANSPDLIRLPRSYSREPSRQVLRWLATVIKKQFPDSVEVQCYFDATTRRIVVSANTNEDNKRIRQFLRDGGLRSLLADAPDSLTDIADRPLRHMTKLARRMDPTAGPQDPTSEAIFAAIAEDRFDVPKRSYTQKGGTFDMHAERRILDYVMANGPGALNLGQLAGTMRPCGTCASELAVPAEAHRGPFWQSIRGKAGVDIEQLIAKNQRDGIGTSVTRSRNGKFTFATDTDSDSDA